VAAHDERSTIVSIWAKSRPRLRVLVLGSALTRRVVMSQTHHRTVKITSVLRAISQVGWTDKLWENTMIAATMTRS
jgi:hypothetical protein